MSFRDEITKINSINHEEESEKKVVELIEQLLTEDAKRCISSIKSDIRAKAEQSNFRIIDEKKVITGKCTVPAHSTRENMIYIKCLSI